MKWLIYCFFLLPFLSGAQSTYFNNLYDYNLQSDGGSNIQVTDSGYIAVGFTTAGNYYISVLRVDSQGNEIDTKAFGVPGMHYSAGGIGSFISTMDGGFASGGWTTDTIGSDGMLIKYDNEGDTLWTRSYGMDSVDDGFTQVKQTPDKGFALIGSWHDGTDWTGRLVKTDSLGNMMWEETFFNVYAYSIDVCHDNGFVISGQYSLYPHCPTYIKKMDSLGGVEWVKFIGGPNCQSAGVVKQTSDSGYIVAADSTYSKYGNRQFRLTKLDKNGNTEWNNTYSDVSNINQLMMPIELNDGSFVVMGNGIDSGYYGSVLKVSAEGDSIWMRKHRVRDKFTSHYLRDMELTKDNGFIATGFVFSEPNVTQDLWILKMDSFGCIVPNCHMIELEVGLNEEDNIPELKIYPNPTTGQFTIQGATGTITVHDLLGKLVLTANEPQTLPAGRQVDMSGFPKGVYFVKVGQAVRKLVVQ